MKSLNRRTFLRAAGGVAVALPLLDAMRPTRARAQEATPRRIIFEFKPNGDQTERRFASLGAQDFELGEFLAPLEPYRKDLLFVHRLNKNFSRFSQGERPDNHQQGTSSLAPWPFGEGDFPVGGEERTIGYVLGPSADHAIGGRILAECPDVPYRHFVQRVGDRNNDIWNLSSHAGPAGEKNPVLPETDPYLAYARLFGFFGESASESVLAHNLAMRKSVLDLTQEQLQSLAPKLGYQDRQRLELHVEAIRDLERTLGGGLKSAECQALALGAELDAYAGTNHVEIAGLFFKLTALAFSCDLTRVATFNWSGGVSQRVYSNLGIQDGHHDISHRTDDDSFTLIRSIHKHLWQHTTTLYEELMATPEGEGGEGSLWDSTLVVHYNELGQGDVHSTHDNLVVLAGGARGFFKKNELVDFGGAGSFTDLLVACFHYMGMDDVETFGDPRLSDGAGPLAGLVA